MRWDVKKFLFFGHSGSLQIFFKKAQEMALVHFIDVFGHKTEVSEDILEVIHAIKIIKEFPLLKQKIPENESEGQNIIQTILKTKELLDNSEEEQRVLKHELARIKVFGQFSLNDIKAIEKESGLKIQFFLAKKSVNEKKELPKNLIYITQEHGLDYFISISKESMQYENMIEMFFEHELNTLKNHLAITEKKIADYKKDLAHLTKYNTFLHHLLNEKTNAFNLAKAENFSQEKMDGSLFVVEGWVPVHKIGELQKATAAEEVEMIEIAIEEGETVPTYLENKGMNRIGEDLVHIYDTPSSNDKDPSLWVLFSFALFFAMIINDAGYGLLFLVAALYFRFKNSKLPRVGVRIWKLSIMLCSFCVVWGVLTNSFFGLNLEPNSPLRKFSLVHWLVEKKAEYHFEKKDAVYEDWGEKYLEIKAATTPKEFLAGAKKEINGVITNDMITKFSDGILMELALLAGIIHITLSFLRYIRRNYAGLGWILAIWGCLFYLPLMLKATSLFHYALGFDKELMAGWGLQLIYAGVGLAVFFGLIFNKWLGLLEITNVIQIFADILSYLRLYALGLAGAIISATLNDIAGSLNFLAGALLLIIGHGLNMVLAVVGGVIHGLRLNFIEWYHYSFEGGGKMFNPLRKIETD